MERGDSEMRIIKNAAQRRRAVLVPVLCSSLLLGAGVAGAAGQEQMGQSGQSTMGQSTKSTQSGQSKQQGMASLPDAYKLSNWIGKPVRNTTGEDLGKVDELVMDDFGVVRYVILNREGQNSGGKNRVAVPLEHFLYPAGQQQQALVLDVSPEQIAQAPSFDSSSWPNMGDEKWSTLVITYWLPEKTAAQQGQQQAQQSQQAPTGQSGGMQSEASRDVGYLPRQKEQLFSRLDKDSDDAIQRSEAQSYAPVAQQFEQLDTYSNGRLSRSEFAAFELRDQPPQGAGQQ